MKTRDGMGQKYFHFIDSEIDPEKREVRHGAYAPTPIIVL